MQTATTDHCHAGLHDVACDVCTVRKRKARKSCLQCLASYCENHLQSHFEAPPLKKHKLVEPSKKLQENVCSRHDEVMKMFCRTDQQSICYLCSLDEHKGHDIVSAAAERSEKQRELEVSRQNIQQRIQDTEKDVKLLQQEVEDINGSADKTVGNSEKMFTELIRLMKKRRSDVKQQVRSHQQTEVSRVRERQKKLEQEITELKRKDAELKKLLNTEDHIWFLNDYPSVSALSESTHSSSIKIRPLSFFEDVTAAVSEVRDKLHNVLTEKWTNILQTLTQVDVLPPEPEPKTRAEFLEYSCDSTLDPKITQVMTEVDVLLSEPEPKTKAEVLEYSCDITLDPKISHTVAEVDVLPSEPEPKTKAEFLEYPCDISLYPKITQVVTEVDVLRSEPEPKTRAEFVEYSCDITLDPKITQVMTEVNVLRSEPEPKTKAEVLEYSCDITLDPKITQVMTEVDVLQSEPEPKTKAEVLEYSCDITLDPKISQTVAEVDVLLPEPEPEPEPEPTTRDEFLKYSCDITLDSKTEHVYLLSVGNRKVTFMSKHQSYSSHPDRFTYYRQVLSKESLTGRCYWEVERTGRGVCVAVTYKNIRRAGNSDECVFGRNDKSWALDCYNNRYTFWSNKVHTPVSGPRSSRVGVYLDHTAGILSFYNISETMTLLHRVQTTFTQPLHAGLRFGYWCPGDSAELCKLK